MIAQCGDKFVARDIIHDGRHRICKASREMMTPLVVAYKTDVGGECARCALSDVANVGSVYT